MKRYIFIFAVFVSLAGLSGINVNFAEATNPSGKPEAGQFNIGPKRVRNGEEFRMELINAPKNSRTKLWVDNGDGKGFQDFGEWLRTGSISAGEGYSGGYASRTITLNCDSYSELEPGKSLRIGERALVQKIYAEYISGESSGKVSPTVFHVKDCRTNPENYREPTGNYLFPYTVKSVFGTDWVNKPLPSGFSAPLKSFAGRYFDGEPIPYKAGQKTGFYWRFLNGGRSVKVVGNRIYIHLASTIAAYNKDSFINRLVSEPLAVFEGTNEVPGKDYMDGILPWDAYFYPEHPDNVLASIICECHDNSRWFDADDRGYVYVYNTVLGIAVAKDDDTALRPVTWITPSEKWKIKGSLVDLPVTITVKNGSIKITNAGYPDFIPGETYVVKAGGGYYLAVVDVRGEGMNNKGVQIFNVTDPLNPQFVTSFPVGPFGSVSTDIAQVGDTVAMLYGVRRSGSSHVARAREVRIYNAADFVAGLAPKKTFSASASDGAEGAYMSLAMDKASGKFYSIHYTSDPAPKSSVPSYVLPTASISVFAPGAARTADTYAETKFPLSAESMGGKGGKWSDARYLYTAEAVHGLNYENGYLTTRGTDWAGTTRLYDNVKIWIFKDGQPQELDTKDFFNSYYNKTGNRVAAIKNTSVHTLGGKDYLFIGSGWLGDVYELTPTDRDTVTTPPVVEICGNGIDDDKDGQVDEGCILYTPPPSPTSCTASLTFDKTSVAYGGSMTENWTVIGADLGQVYGDCGSGATPISAGPQSYTINNLTKTTTCRVYGKIAGQEKCTASATVTVGTGTTTPPATPGQIQYFPTAVTYNFGTVTLRRGSTGSAVMELQRFLNADLKLNLVVDGKLGPKTVSVIKTWQAAHGLVADGLVGAKTKAVMGR